MTAIRSKRCDGHLDERMPAFYERLQDMGGPSLFEEIVRRFLRDATGMIQELESALVLGSPECLREAALRIKGRGAALGALRLCQLADELQALAPSLDGDTSTKKGNELRTELELVVSLLR